MAGAWPDRRLPNWHPCQPPPFFDSPFCSDMTQRGQYTHPAFVGQEFKECRLLPFSLLLAIKVLAINPSPHPDTPLPSPFPTPSAPLVSQHSCQVVCISKFAHCGVCRPTTTQPLWTWVTAPALGSQVVCSGSNFEDPSWNASAPSRFYELGFFSCANVGFGILSLMAKNSDLVVRWFCRPPLPSSIANSLSQQDAKRHTEPMSKNW